MHKVDAIAGDETPHSVSKTINHALLPRLHLTPVVRDGFCMDTHRGEFFLARLRIAFGRGKQGFERDTAAMQAGSTQWSPVDQGDVMSQLCSAYRRDIATWTGPQY